MTQISDEEVEQTNKAVMCTVSMGQYLEGHDRDDLHTLIQMQYSFRQWECIIAAIKSAPQLRARAVAAERERDEAWNAAIEAAKEAIAFVGYESTGTNKLADNLHAALAAFAPEPEFEYVLPELCDTNGRLDDWITDRNLSGQDWVDLRELTRVPKKPKGREE